MNVKLYNNRPLEVHYFEFMLSIMEIHCIVMIALRNKRGRLKMVLKKINLFENALKVINFA